MAETVDPARRAQPQPPRERPQQPHVAIRVGDHLPDGRPAPQPRGGKALRRLAEVAEGAAAVPGALPPRAGTVFTRGEDFAQQRLVAAVKVGRAGTAGMVFGHGTKDSRWTDEMQDYGADEILSLAGGSLTESAVCGILIIVVWGWRVHFPSTKDRHSSRRV